MANKLNAREVLSCLNQLGYINIDAQQLKEFMHDLKVLRKYEEKKKQREKENVDVTNDCSCRTNNNDDIANRLYTQATEASKAKIKKLITTTTIQINRPKLPAHIHCIHQNHDNYYDDKVQIDNNDNNCSTSSKNVLTDSNSNHKILTGAVALEQITQTNDDNGAVLRTSSDLDKAVQVKFRNKAKARKPKGFIRPPTDFSCKSDPVALYHRYQEEWKKRKLPGEDNRSQLRWTIRDKMMG